MKRLKNGFTLAEILMTLAIIGIIAAIGIPQIVSMAQKHSSEVSLAKTVHEMELGCQKILTEANSANNMSSVDKILLISTWRLDLARAIGLSEKTAKTAWTNLFIAPAFAKRNPEQTTKQDTDLWNECGYGANCSNTPPTLPGSTINVSDLKFNTGDSDTNNSTKIVDDSTAIADALKDTGRSKKDDEFICIIPPSSYYYDGDTAINGEKKSSNNNADTIYKLAKVAGEVKIATNTVTVQQAKQADTTVLTLTLDTNGFGKGRDVAGYDVFTFNLNNVGKMIPADDATAKVVSNGFKIDTSVLNTKTSEGTTTKNTGTLEYNGDFSGKQVTDTTIDEGKGKEQFRPGNNDSATIKDENNNRDGLTIGITNPNPPTVDTGKEKVGGGTTDFGAKENGQLWQEGTRTFETINNTSGTKIGR